VPQFQEDQQECQKVHLFAKILKCVNKSIAVEENPPFKKKYPPIITTKTPKPQTSFKFRM
jgi:hypothetical protein